MYEPVVNALQKELSSAINPSPEEIAQAFKKLKEEFLRMLEQEILATRREALSKEYEEFESSSKHTPY